MYLQIGLSLKIVVILISHVHLFKGNFEKQLKKNGLLTITINEFMAQYQNYCFLNEYLCESGGTHCICHVLKKNNIWEIHT